MSSETTLIQRINEEIRAACRVVAEEGKQSVFSVRKAGERAIGEWLTAVRQPREIPRPVPMRSKRLQEEADALRGDLTRVHVMKVKGGRGTMQDAIVRSSRVSY